VLLRDYGGIVEIQLVRSPSREQHMLEKPQGYRPQVETFAVAGGRFDLVDPVGLLSDVRDGFEPVLQPSTFPAPLLEVAVLIAAAPGITADRTAVGTGDGPGVRFQGRITLAPAVAEGRVHPAVVGVAYVAPLLGALSRLLGADETVKDTPDGRRSSTVPTLVDPRH
jgi:hypothetical protein